MRVIILDDETYRHDYYRRLHKEAEVVACRTVAECRAALAASPCDLLSLDYDLENGSSVGILAALAHEPQKPKRVRVHSRSERGGPLLMRGLRSIGFEPTYDQFSYRKAKELLGYAFNERRAG